MGIVMSYGAAVRGRPEFVRRGPFGASSPVLLHDEPPATPPDLTQPRLQPSLLAALVAADTPSQRQRTVKTLLQSLGFEWLGYGRFIRAGERVTPLSFCTTYADPRWVQHYFNESFHLVDPRLQLAPESSLPCVWTIEQLEAHEAPASLRALQQRFFTELRDTGIRSGVMLALPGLPGHERHVISLLSCRPGSEWITDTVLGQVLTLALCLHEFYSRYTQPPQAESGRGTSALTPLQCEILARVARGMPDKLIASQLDLSLHNVDYHMRQLRKRFGVRNRVQLMQAALGPMPHVA